MNPVLRNGHPPNYTEVLHIDHGIAPNELRSWYTEQDWTPQSSPYNSADYQQIFTPNDVNYDESGMHPHGRPVQRSESKSSGSSGDSSNRVTARESLYFNDNSLLNKELPDGWKLSFTTTGRICYTHLPTDTQHWNHPHEKTDLPPGWERIYNKDYGEYYVNHITKTAQFPHPGQLTNPISGEEHAHALALVKLRRLQDKSHSSTYVPPSQYLSEEIPDWLQEYATSNIDEYEWTEQSYETLDKYQTMMTRLYRDELRTCIEQYEGYRNRILRELEDRMQLQDLHSKAKQTKDTSTNHELETFV